MMKRINLAAACLCALLAFTAILTGVPRAHAYLTSHARTQGYVSISLDGSRTRLEDSVADWEKKVAITNTGESACRVRVRFFVGQKYADYITYRSDSDRWSLSSDGYWYYDADLAPGASTPELLAALDREKFSKDFTEAGSEDFSVIVVHEYARIQYDNEGKPFVDWDEKIVPDR